MILKLTLMNSFKRTEALKNEKKKKLPNLPKEQGHPIENGINIDSRGEEEGRNDGSKTE